VHTIFRQTLGAIPAGLEVKAEGKNKGRLTVSAAISVYLSDTKDSYQHYFMVDSVQSEWKCDLVPLFILMLAPHQPCKQSHSRSGKRPVANLRWVGPPTSCESYVRDRRG
jgi:hypothetical protein